MKRRISYVTAALTLLGLIFWGNPGSLRGAPLPDGFNNARPQARLTDKTMTENSDQDLREEKSQRFKVIEWLIRQNLMKQYQRLEGVAEEPDDSVE